MNYNFICILMQFCSARAVADPGFPVGGALTHWGGANLQHIHFSAKMYVKTKEIDPVGGHAPAAPPGSTNVEVHTTPPG